jgi:hypothetical protein
MAILRVRLFFSKLFPGFMSHIQKRAWHKPDIHQNQRVEAGGKIG